MFLGEDEVKNNVIACKDMTSGEQTTLDFAATLARIRDGLAERNKGKVIVENANFVQKHVKPRRMGEAGGIIKAESAIYACKVQVVCPRCGKPTRVTHKVLEDGTKERICKKCGESL